MADVTVKRTEDFEPTFGGGMLKARAGLGVTSFGMQILRFPPNSDRHPTHDHSERGQEEVYTVLEGAATLQAGGEEHRLEPGVFARVGPNENRKLVTGEEGAVVLALGGIPGQPFETTKFTDEGEPDPLASAGDRGADG
jgi:quercetin dioxygenase-like cupin family protein